MLSGNVLSGPEPNSSVLRLSGSIGKEDGWLASTKVIIILTIFAARGTYISSIIHAVYV